MTNFFQNSFVPWQKSLMRFADFSSLSLDLEALGAMILLGLWADGAGGTTNASLSVSAAVASEKTATRNALLLNSGNGKVIISSNNTHADCLSLTAAARLPIVVDR